MSTTHKSFVKQLAGETAIYGLSNILSRVLHYVLLTVYLTRVFETQSYAIYTDLYAYVALLLILFTFRMETAYFRFGSAKETSSLAFTSASASVWIMTITLATTMILLRNEIASILTYPDKGRYVVYFACILVFDAFAAIPFAKLRLDNRPIRFAAIKILNVLVTIFLVFLFLEGFPWLIEQGWTNLESVYDYDRRLDLVFIANLIASAMVLVFLIPTVVRIKLKFSSGLWKKMFWYVVPLVIVGMAGVFNQSFAVPILKYILPGSRASVLDTAGLYAAAAKLALLLNLFTQAFNYAAEPFFFKNAAKENARAIYADVAQAFSLAASVGMLGILLFLDIFVLILGPDYRTSIGIVPILLVAYWFLGLYYNFSIWYKLKDRTLVGAIISIGGSIVTLVIAMTMIEQYGAIAMAWATAACYAFMCTAGYLTGQKYYRIDYPIKRMFMYFGLGLGIYLISKQASGLFENTVLHIFINMLLFLVYLFSLYGLEKTKIREWLET